MRPADAGRSGPGATDFTSVTGCRGSRAPSEGAPAAEPARPSAAGEPPTTAARPRPGGRPSLAVHPRLAVVRREAVEQARTARLLEARLAATRRGVGRVPGPARRRAGEPVVVAEERGAFRAARPVVAGAVLARREGGAIHLRSGQDVVLVRRIAHAARVHRLATFVERVLVADVRVVVVQVVDARRDQQAVRVVPRA